MADVVSITEGSAEVHSFTGLVAEAPQLAEELEARKDCFPGWACVLLGGAMAIGSWGMLYGGYCLIQAVLH
jgi:phosphate/sulfate permease